MYPVANILLSKLKKIKIRFKIKSPIFWCPNLKKIKIRFKIKLNKKKFYAMVVWYGRNRILPFNENSFFLSYHLIFFLCQYIDGTVHISHLDHYIVTF